MEVPPQNLGTGRVEVFDAELWTIGLALNETIKKRETLQRHGVKTVAVFSDSQAAIRRTAHLEPGPAQRVVRRLNRGRRPSSLMASHPKSIGTRGTLASPESKKQTAR